MLDMPPVGPQQMWTFGRNVRFRMGALETIGLWAPLQDVNDQQIVIPADPLDAKVRRIYTTPSTITGQILAASANRVTLIQFDPASTPVQGTRWETFDVTPAGLSNLADALPNPDTGRVQIPPQWWFSDQDDVVVGGRANVAEPTFAWDRLQGSPFAPLAGSPQRAVGGGIINRILVLLGCTSFTDPDPGPSLTVRWSDRFNFEEWTPSDTNVSGELQLEGGSRIVGGGVTGYGVVAWTDRRMAILNETGSISTVFSRRYVDGSRGLLANRAWCEADGRIWWLDESRTLNVFDGGAPRQVMNPLRYATIERVDPRDAARIYIEPNTEFSEIIIHYADLDSSDIDRQLVYNYQLDAWAYWELPRTAWCNRFGVINTLGVDWDNRVWRHDLDIALNSAYLGPPALIPTPFPLPIPPATPILSGPVEAVDFYAYTNPITMPDLTSQTWRATRLHVNHLPATVEGVTDEIAFLLTGYGQSQIENTQLFQDFQIMALGDMAADFRVSGKALQVGLIGTGIRSVIRFGPMTVTAAEGGTR